MSKRRTFDVISLLVLTVAFVAACGRMSVLDSLKSTPIGTPTATKSKPKTFTEKRTLLGLFYGWYDTVERDGVPVTQFQLKNSEHQCSVLAQIGNSDLKSTTSTQRNENGREIKEVTESTALAEYFDPTTKQKIVSDSMLIQFPVKLGCAEIFLVGFMDRGIWTSSEAGVEYHFDGQVLKKKSGSDELDLVKLKIDFSISKTSESNVSITAKQSDMPEWLGQKFLLVKQP